VSRQIFLKGCDRDWILISLMCCWRTSLLCFSFTWQITGVVIPEESSFKQKSDSEKGTAKGGLTFA